MKMRFIKFAMLAASAMFALCKTVSAKVAETENAFVVSGENYAVDFCKTSGAITRVESLGKNLELGFDGNLWTAKFADKSQMASKNAKFAGKIENGRLCLNYESEDIDVVISVKDGKDFLEIESNYTPKKADLLEFSVPSCFAFKPENLVSLSAEFNYPRNSGLVFNKNFFMPKNMSSQNIFWVRGKNYGMGVYKKIFGSSMKSYEPFREQSPITLGKDAAEWLGERLCKELVKTEKIPTRTFGKNSADIVIANSKNGVFIGGKKIGEGAIFRIGGWFLKDESQVEYVKAMALHSAKLLSKTKRNKICVIDCNTNQWENPRPSEYVAAFGNVKNFCVIRNANQLQQALEADDVAAIINPLQECCLPWPDGTLMDLVEPLREFAENGGYWFETGGFSFMRQMEPKKYFSVKNRVPSAIADFIHFNMLGKNVALYSVQPITWQPFEGLNDKTKIFTPSEFSFGGNENGGYVDRAFLAYVNKGESFKAPNVKILFGKGEIESAKSFCQDNKVLKKLEQKMPQKFFGKFKKSVMMKVNDSNTKDAMQTVAALDFPMVVHVSGYLRGGFDKQYPDHYPPRASYGTNEEYLAFIEFCKSKGHLYMPYTNNTWWCDSPKGPTFEAKGRAALSLDENGKEIFEKYGTAEGWTTCMWQKDVRDANDKLLKESLVDYKSDIVFQDQSGARAFRYDYNKAAPTPSAYSEGFISTVMRDSKKAYLSTEDGWWGICDGEIQFCGMSFSFMQQGKWYKCIWDTFPKDSFTLGNLTGAFFHDKVSLTHHDLGTDVNTPRKLVYTVAYGYSMVNQLYVRQLNFAHLIEWRRWTAQIQMSLLSKLIGEPMQNFSHKWTNAALDGDDSATIFSQYGDIKIAAAIGNTTLKIGNYTVANDGFFAKGKDVECAFNLVKLGNVKAETPSSYIMEKCGKELKFYFFAKPNEKVLFAVPKKAVAVKLQDGRELPIESSGNAGVITAPESDANSHTLFKGSFIF